MNNAVWVPRNKGILIWHFVPQDGRLKNYDGGTEYCPAGKRRYRREDRPLVTEGATYRTEGPPILCQRGLHGSVRALDALRYAPSTTLTRAVLWGAILRDTDKAVATHRTVLSKPTDVTNILLEWACLCAEHAFDRLRGTRQEPDQRSVAALAVIRRWCRGEVTSAELKDAHAAARAARAAADAAHAAADAARATAHAAAWAADAAAWAAWAAARAADAAWAADAAAWAADAAARAADAAWAADAAARAAADAAWAADAAADADGAAVLSDKLETMLEDAF